MWTQILPWTSSTKNGKGLQRPSVSTNRGDTSSTDSASTLNGQSEVFFPLRDRIDGLLCMKCPYEKLQQLLDLFIQKGIERTLALCGWMVACHFNSALDPVDAQVLFSRKPRAPAVSEDSFGAFSGRQGICWHAISSLCIEGEAFGVLSFSMVCILRGLPPQDILDV